MILTAVEIKLLRLMLDAQAHNGEVEVSRRKLISSLATRGKSVHDVVEMIQAASEQNLLEPPAAPRMSTPDYGLCRMPFGPNKGQLFMDIAPSDLRSARNWAMKTPELAQKFRGFIRDVDAFLRQSAL